MLFICEKVLNSFFLFCWFILIFVFLMVIFILWILWGSECLFIENVMVLLDVNLSVLFNKLLSICLIWNILLMSFLGSGCKLNINLMCLLWEDLVMIVIIFLSSLLGEKGWLLICSLLVLILEKLRILLMIVSRLFVVVFIILICFCWLVGSDVLFNFLLNFKMVLRGVWILWFMLVRNWDLMLLVFIVFLCVIFKWVFCFLMSFILLCKLFVVCLILFFSWFLFFFINVKEKSFVFKKIFIWK